eukprot:GDKI01038470.1.p1 GENE.GDKI01038470.1~~GDKI01038470.1.p1  ORF type:complete len:102 (+),score=26.01 GDKI01038470.1:273-578(+)
MCVSLLVLHDLVDRFVAEGVLSDVLSEVVLELEFVVHAHHGLQATEGALQAAAGQTLGLSNTQSHTHTVTHTGICALTYAHTHSQPPYWCMEKTTQPLSHA